MIILDIETTGLSPSKNSMVSLGAVDYTTNEEFYGECQIASLTEIDDFALCVNGFTREQVTDSTKQWSWQLYLTFMEWAKGREMLLAGQQVGAFDILFLKHIHETNIQFGGVKWPFGHRSVDLHSVAFAQLGKSLSLDGILEAVGLEPEPKPHSAITGARLETKAFRLLLNA